MGLKVVLRPIVVTILAVVMTACANAAPSEAEAEKLIVLTRTTTTTYSVFNWNVVTPVGEPAREEWSAEFHKGVLHRVETPSDRIVADCAAMSGTYLNLRNGEIIRGPQIARAACGVQANAKALETRLIGSGSGKFGETSKILVRDPGNVRTYEIAQNGAIVGASIEDLNAAILLRMTAVAMLGSADDAIFDESSLNESAVPSKYKVAPRN